MWRCLRCVALIGFAFAKVVCVFYFVLECAVCVVLFCFVGLRVASSCLVWFGVDVCYCVVCVNHGVMLLYCVLVCCV